MDLKERYLTQETLAKYKDDLVLHKINLGDKERIDIDKLPELKEGLFQFPVCSQQKKQYFFGLVKKQTGCFEKWWKKKDR